MKKTVYLAVLLCTTAQMAVAGSPSEPYPTSQGGVEGAQQGIIKVGEEVTWSTGSPQIDITAKAEEAEVVWENITPTDVSSAQLPPPPPPPTWGGFCDQFSTPFCTYKLSKPDLCCRPTWTAPGAYCPLICI